MTARSYSTPLAFKQALEQRLRAASTNGLYFARRRQLLVFDRFLARVAISTSGIMRKSLAPSGRFDIVFTKTSLLPSWIRPERSYLSDAAALSGTA